MDNVKHINQDQDRLIKTIELLLDEAKKGELTSFVAACAYSNNYTANMMLISDEDNRCAIIGELRLLERDFIDLFCQTRRQPAWEFCE